MIGVRLGKWISVPIDAMFWKWEKVEKDLTGNAGWKKRRYEKKSRGTQG